METTAIVGAVVVAVVALIVVLVWAGVRRRRVARREFDALNGWAMRAGLRPVPPVAAKRWIGRLPGRGRVRYLATGLFRDRPVFVGEYVYTDFNGPNNNVQRHSLRVVCVTLRVPYPYLAVQERGAASGLWRKVRGHSRNETGDPQFDRDFQVVTAYPLVVRHVIGPSVTRFMLGGGAPPWSVAGFDLVTVEPGTLHADRAGEYLNQACDLADLLGVPPPPPAQPGR